MTKIEWVRNDDGTQGKTWNPVTGCLHNCDYCYARGITRRFGGGEAWDRGSSINNDLHVLFTKPEKPFPFHFEPTLHSYRLDEPQKRKKPTTYFVGSMCDLFGDWIPDEWIAEVFKACQAANVPVFLKNKLADIWREPLIQQLPWEV